MPPFRPSRSLRPERPRIPRRALPWYAAAGLLALLTALLVHGSLERAAAAEAAYGTTRPVVVVSRPVPAGAALTARDVDVADWPVALAPEGALDRLPHPATATVALLPGEPLLADRVADHGRTGPVALLGRGERAVVVPLALTGLPLEVGDSVDVIAGGAYGGGPDGDLPVGPEASVVAAGARVLTVLDEQVVVAVRAATAVDVAAALGQGPVVVALRPPGA